MILTISFFILHPHHHLELNMSLKQEVKSIVIIGMIFFDILEQYLPLKQGVRQGAALRLKSVHSLAKKSSLASQALDIIIGLKMCI